MTGRIQYFKQRNKVLSENTLVDKRSEDWKALPNLRNLDCSLESSTKPNTAMSRHFHYKPEIPAPDETCRL